ncbi:MAG: hypothetical protein A4E26_01467 [Methanobacterium sp. PtaU1.Bin097]|nr:MAG: hypothetical protein A4E26_01467 [Methanobacterium sp. PtaU1.Bin097]
MLPTNMVVIFSLRRIPSTSMISIPVSSIRFKTSLRVSLSPSMVICTGTVPLSVLTSLWWITATMLAPNLPMGFNASRSWPGTSKSSNTSFNLILSDPFSFLCYEISFLINISISKDFLGIFLLCLIFT